MESFEILRLWAACAWADGELHPAESAALGRFLAAADDMTADQRVQAAALLESAPDVDAASVRELSPIARQGVYRAARHIVRLDGRVTDDEIAFLDRLRGALDLDAEEIARIESES